MWIQWRAILILATVSHTLLSFLFSFFGNSFCRSKKNILMLKIKWYFKGREPGKKAETFSYNSVRNITALQKEWIKSQQCQILASSHTTCSQAFAGAKADVDSSRHEYTLLMRAGGNFTEWGRRHFIGRVEHTRKFCEKGQKERLNSQTSELFLILSIWQSREVIRMQAGEKDKLARPSRIHTMVPVNILIGMIMMIKMMLMDNCNSSDRNSLRCSMLHCQDGGWIGFSLSSSFSIGKDWFQHCQYL